ncbi:uncharacterized protein RCO7_05632 [Rhynchosporium graminicola]|uniref:Protein kinase domain-containing protein n=1 Tax=Rhynchosporium graminicola TaxID=2792576 RepID=A0A1E1L0G7_9HELO|nr:uncharacterized protein RCO7_05632 [Rhynchosporium commune]
MAVNLNANPGVAANPGTLAFYTEYQDWDMYNDPTQAQGILTVAQINAAYLTSPFVLPPPLPPPIPVPPAVNIVPARRASQRRQRVETVPTAAASIRIAALLAPVPSLTGLGGVDWTGVKHLGTGGGGALTTASRIKVTLWEYTGPAPAPPIHNKIVVKQQDFPSPNLLNEGAFISDLTPAMSQHIVELLVNPATVMTSADATNQLGLAIGGAAANAWIGSVRRLIMEYCSSGTLDDLGAIRSERSIRLEELTMWKIFECLVDSCTVLEHQQEFVIDAAGMAQIHPNSMVNRINDQGVLVHFDLKPPNVMIKRDVTGVTHPNTPICKLGDFGLASYMPRDGSGVDATGFFPLPWATNEENRERVCFESVGVQAHRPFTPGPLNGAPTLGRAFGTEIQAVPFISALLKDTIQECLYENPDNRPDLQDLKNTIMAAITAMEAAGVQPEGWQDLERLEPLTAAQDIAAAYALRSGVRCNALKGGLLGTPRCKNKLKARANNLRPRCQHHWDLRRYPLL